MSDLHDDLQTVDGVGEKTADAIVEVLDDYSPEYDGGYMQKAKQAAQAGDYNTAGIYLRRAWK
jgi:Holliday junction resolvasome RuvABC DNA-binding subunit